MRKSLGSKRHQIEESDKEKILELYKDFKETKYSKYLIQLILDIDRL